MEILNYSFFQNALWGALLASVLCAMVGTYVVTRRLVIAGGGIAHASLGGVGMGAYFGFSPLLGATGFAVLTGFAVQQLSSRREMREDAAVAMLWTLGMSLGLLFAFLTPGFVTDLQSYLFGNILSITTADLYRIGGLTLSALVCFIGGLRTIEVVAYDRDFAQTQGLPVKWIEAGLTILVALTIVSCLQLVGIIMVVALLSVPQTTAALFVHTFRAMMMLSALLSFVACLGGLTMSYWFNIPSGAAIILIAIGLYLCAKAMAWSWTRRKRYKKHK